MQSKVNENAIGLSISIAFFDSTQTTSPTIKEKKTQIIR